MSIISSNLDLPSHKDYSVVYNIVMTFLNRFSAFFLPLLFFVVGLTTLYDYGMNWDSPIHFARGQAYLRYILTGKTNYNDLPSFCMNEENLISRVDYKTGEICDRHRRVRVSEYESPLLDFNSWVAKSVYGHPAFSDIMLAISNNVFFRYLGWVEDINAYHLYSLFTTFLLVLTVSVWTKQTFGTFASIIAVLTIYTFPLLAGEQHFNVKDPPMAAFFTISLYLFWSSIVKKKVLYLVLSALVGGASFGTKFNFVFAPVILLPWTITYGAALLRAKMARVVLSRTMLFTFGFYPVIIFLVFFLTWPALWPDPLSNIPQVFKYYQDIGGPSCTYSPFTSLWWTQCAHLITPKYFIYTMPPFSLFLFSVGFIVSMIWFRKKNYLPFLLLSFFLTTILRVTLPIASIYGGLRQIMEFIAPMAMIAGIGALFLRDLTVRLLIKFSFVKGFNKKTISRSVSLLFVLGYIPIAMEMVRLHPNENVYFNFFIGGLKGAAEKNFPGYGNTYGNAYLQGVKWLNQNAEAGAKLALVSGLGQNLSRSQLRYDINFANNYRSGYNQEGEYLMLLIAGNETWAETFRHKYLSLLNPLFDLKVDTVSLLTIWKNDKNFLKDGVNLDSQIERGIDIKFAKEESKKEIIIELNGSKNLKGLGLTFPSQECKDGMIGTKIYISTNGSKYIQKAEGINNFTDRETLGYNADFVYLFPGDKAQYIKVIPPESYSCELSTIDFSIFTFVRFYNNSNQ